MKANPFESGPVRVGSRKLDRLRNFLLILRAFVFVGMFCLILLVSDSSDHFELMDSLLVSLLFGIGLILIFFRYNWKESPEKVRYIEWQKNLLNFSIKADLAETQIQYKNIAEISIGLNTIYINLQDETTEMIHLRDFWSYKDRQQIKSYFLELQDWLNTQPFRSETSTPLQYTSVFTVK